jgi:hypothetical protein
MNTQSTHTKVVRESPIRALTGVLLFGILTLLVFGAALHLVRHPQASLNIMRRWGLVILPLVVLAAAALQGRKRKRATDTDAHA